MNLDLLHCIESAYSGLALIGALWVLCASVWRLNLLKWGASQRLQIVAYVCIAMWAFGRVIGVHELKDAELFGVVLRDAGYVGIALLFFAGSKRWLFKAPDDTVRVRP
jgi:hypothetical protein